MCGIYGYYNVNKSNQSSFHESFVNVKNKLFHRGPNDSGVSSFNNVTSKIPFSMLCLGHMRLSVIDLSDSGRQPIASPCGRFTLIYNGEIYNYLELAHELKSLGVKLRSLNDTEVLLQAWSLWKSDAIPRLNGMFAFAVYDKSYAKLTLVRDGFGIKPLYYWFDKNSFCFGSELCAITDLVPIKLMPNWHVINNYLSLGRVDRGEDTFFDGVRHLLPGHFLEIDLNYHRSITPKKWWHPKLSEDSNITFNEAKDILREKFLDNVKLQLRSDVPLGASLSGGIDSSAVVCAMRYLEPNSDIRTFSYTPTGSSKNEEKWVDIVNEHVGAKPYKIDVKKTDIFKDFETLIKIQGEPFGSPSIYAQYRVFKEIAKAGVVVNLDGQGADELLAGYFGYPRARFESLIAKRDFLKIFKLYNGLGQTFGKYPSNEFIQALFRDVSEYFVAKRTVRFNKSYLNNEFSAQFIQKSTLVKRSHNHRALSSCLSEAITGQRGLVHLLRYEDRNSMSHSIESRVPFLTIDMAEFLLSLPENFLLSDEGVTKYIFREAMRGIVPDKILDRKDKIGFETPDNQWLLAEKNTITIWLKQFDQIPMLDSSKALLFYEGICNGKNQDFLGFWRLINFYKWYEQNNF